MKILKLIIVTLLCSQVSNGQVLTGQLQASGLTCALCAKSIHQGLSALYFVDSVDVDLESSTFLLNFKSNQLVDPAIIKKKVEDAGFFIASLKLMANPGNNEVKTGAHLGLSGSEYHVAASGVSKDKKEITLELIDEGFVSAKLHKKYLASSKLSCFGSQKTAEKLNKEAPVSGSVKKEFHVLIK